jgi:predicted lipoprotein with Yx(FWY)xxD motif
VKRSNMLLAVALTGVMTASAVAAASAGEPTAHLSRAATVQLRSTSLGKILVDSSGFTVYEFTKDSRNKDTCVKVRGCSAIWPALSAHGSPTAGPGVKASLLSTITLPGGSRQVTYAGHPLYSYSEATERAETSYVGVSHFGGRWEAVSAAGGAVR